MMRNRSLVTHTRNRVLAKAPILLLAVLGVLHAHAAIEGDKQTIGNLLDRSAQNPGRLILSAMPKREIKNPGKAKAGARAAAIEHYERVISLNAAPAIRAEAMRRAADLRVELADSELANEGRSSGAELQVAISLYYQLLREYPDYSAADFVLYQLARAYDLSEDAINSIDTLRRLAVEYPQSKRLNEASFRAAEMLYLHKRYEEAVVEYARITGGNPNAGYWWLAQYKQAWTYYQLDDYSGSVLAFSKILDQLDIHSDISRLDEVLVSAPENKAELVRDAVRGMSKAFSKYTQIDGINTYFSDKKDQYYYPLIYQGLAEIFALEKRYTDAANVYESFSRLHPRHQLAKEFNEQAIGSYLAGGFKELAVTGQEQYLVVYGPESQLWQDQALPDSHRALIRQYMNDVVTFRHEEAQNLVNNDSEKAKQRFSSVADRYHAIISSFPNDERLDEVTSHYADALYEAERFNEAAIQFGKLAYEFKNPESAGDSALAQVKSYRQWYEVLKKNPTDEALVGDAQTNVFNAMSTFANSFPNHPQRSFVLLAGAEDYYQLSRFDEVVAICLPLVKADDWQDDDLHNKALGLLADAYFAKEDFLNSETFYTSLLPRLERGDIELKNIAQSRLAISVYRQAEVAREKGQARVAAALFQRAASLSVDENLVADALFNAAGQLFEVNEWSQSTAVLEQFTARFALHNMIVEADKMLATAYQKSANPSRAAKIYERIATRPTAAEDLRRTAQLSAGKLYISAGQRGEGERVLAAYISSYPAPLDDAQQTRLVLAGLYPATSKEHFTWLRSIVAADEAVGGGSAKSQLMAADASYKLAMADVSFANSIRLSLPIEKSLPRRRAAMEKAISSLAKSSSFGFSDITTLANYELGELYRQFALALLESEVPKKLDGDVLEQYMILLEEQAYPFEEKAIAEYESNMALVGDGVWTPGVRKSLMALAKLAPAKYGKQPQLEKIYDSLY